MRPGGAVTWTYVAANTGNVALSNAQITDDRIDQSAIDWHNRLVGEIDPAEVGIWTPRHPRPGA